MQNKKVDDIFKAASGVFEAADKVFEAAGKVFETANEVYEKEKSSVTGLKTVEFNKNRFKTAWLLFTVALKVLFYGKARMRLRL
jgi:hypothetical protein